MVDPEYGVDFLCCFSSSNSYILFINNPSLRAKRGNLDFIERLDYFISFVMTAVFNYSSFFMLKFIKSFLIFIILYHILVTVVCYGIFGGHYQEIFSLARDGIWIAFIVAVIATHRKHCRAFLTTRKYPLIAF